MSQSIESLPRTLSVDAQLVGLVSDEPSQALLEQISQLNEGAKVKAEIEGLWRVYAGRRARVTYYYGDQTIEERMLATRYYDGSGIEETYWIEDITSPDKKVWEQRAVVSINIGHGQWCIVVDEYDRVVVTYRDPQGNLCICDSDEARACIDDFQYRSLIAADKHKGRSPGAQRAADEDALRQLAMRAPHLLRRRTAVE